MAQLTCWLGSDLETQPWVESTRGNLQVKLVVGVWTAFHCGTDEFGRDDLILEVSATGGTSNTVPLTAGYFANDDQEALKPAVAKDWLEGQRHLADVRDRILGSDQDNNAGLNKYFLVTFDGLQPDDLLRVLVTAVVTRPVSLRVVAEPYAIWVHDPVFTVADVVAARADPEAADEECWILMHRRSKGFDRFRLDLLTTQNPRPAQSPITPIRLRFADREVDLASPGPALPGSEWVGSWVDRSADSIIVTIPSTVALTTITVVTRADQPDPTAIEVDLSRRPPQPWRPAALMIMGYAIQSLNDLLWSPIRRVNDGMLAYIAQHGFPTGNLNPLGYVPPRSYAEITYSDELAVYSGKPEKPENGKADGYRYMLEAQRAYGINTVWAFNAGVLLLLSRGLPVRTEQKGGRTRKVDQWKELVDAVKKGLVSPALAGYGAHRAGYYDGEANVRELMENASLIRQLFDQHSNGVYFGDSRIYRHAPGELAALVRAEAAGTVGYLVMDRSTVATGVPGAEQLLFPDPDPQRRGNFVWRDRDTGLKVLLVEDVLRNNLVNANADEGYRGMVPIEVRRLLMRSFAQDQEGPRRLFLDGDDIEHFCGAGWFDGDDVDFAAGYLTALCWITLHPWVEVVTPESPRRFASGRTFVEEFVRTDVELAITSSIDATMDPEGAASVDQGHSSYFDLWYEAWARFRASWLGCSLAEIAAPLEEALTYWPRLTAGTSRQTRPVVGFDNDLHRLAWLYYLSCTHEGFWSKQPSGSRSDPRDDPFAWDPEDFVVSESLQMRNAWVYLNASIWAHAAASSDADIDGSDHVMTPETTDDLARAGWLIDRVRAAHSADRWWAPHAAAPYADDGLFWDRDNLPNAILYNRDILAVLDANGGVVSHLFARFGNRAISISGTSKAYQFLTLNPQVPCDGPRVQNTVFTPNHAYLGSDVRQARPWFGSFTDQRRPEGESCWWPNNLDRYDCRAAAVGAEVHLTYTGVDVSRLPKEPISEAVAMAAIEEDGRRLRAGLPGVVWHRDPEFTKSIRLTGRELRFTYQGVRSDHLVANEFTLDLLGQLTGKPHANQKKDPWTDGAPGRVRIASPEVAVVVSTVDGCILTAARDTFAQPLDHRVLSDCVIVAPSAGCSDFAYSIGVTARTQPENRAGSSPRSARSGRPGSTTVQAVSTSGTSNV